MGLEVANNIEELDQTWPTGVDPVNKGDDHIRLVKDVLKKQFPGVGGNGFSIPIEALEADLNNCINSTGPFQAQIDNIITNLLMPIGAVVAFAASFATIPDGWFLCDGDNGTVDLTDRFVYGTTVELELGDTGGSKDAVVIVHQHASTGNHKHNLTDPGHQHGMPSGVNGNGSGGYDDANNSRNTPNTNNATTGITMANDGAHQHDPEGVDGTDLNLPPFLRLAYIQRII